MRLIISSLMLILSGCHLSDPSANLSIPTEEKIERAWPIMGTIFSIRVWCHPEISDEAVKAAYESVRKIDLGMSLYKPASELSQLNRAHDAKHSVVVSSMLREVIEKAEEVRRETLGAFNLRVGGLVNLWSLDQMLKGEELDLPNPSLIEKELVAVQDGKIEWSTFNQRAYLTPDHLRIDLNGIAKGYALDQAAKALKKLGVVRARLDLGGQLLFVGDDPDFKRWRVGVRNPIGEGLAGTIDVLEGSVSTSSDDQRYFVHEGKRYGHILDPRTGYPVESKELSITVWAKTGIEADALSTAYFVLGRAKAEPLIKRRSGIKVHWVTSSGTLESS